MTFFFGVRVSTWVAALLFLVPGVRDRRYLVAGAAWLTGFETVFQVTSLVAGKPLPPWRWGPFVLIALGIAVVFVASRRGVLPDRRLMAAVAAIWAVWLVSGFHANAHQMVGLDVFSEVLNEAAKTLWAVAYLWPLWNAKRRPQPGGQGRRVFWLPRFLLPFTPFLAWARKNPAQ